MKASFTLFSLLAFAIPVAGATEPSIGDSLATGDLTLLTSYRLPADRRTAFESTAATVARNNVESNGKMWLLYEELTDAGADPRYFTVHFPHNLSELTEPNSTTYELVAAVGRYRDHADLTRQVPDWCSTVSMDPELLEYAFVEYLWLKPNSLDEAGRLLAQRGRLLRDVYGTTSDGNAAAEGFVSMVSAAHITLVLFSSEAERDAALGLLEADLEERGLLVEWRSVHTRLDALVARRSGRAGRFRPGLSGYSN